MKALTTVIASTLLIASVGASAYDTLDTQVTPVASSKEAAYEMGKQRLDALKSATPYELYYQVNSTLGDIEYDSLQVTDENFIEVQERMDGQGNVGYVGIVNVGLTYDVHESDD